MAARVLVLLAILGVAQTSATATAPVAPGSAPTITASTATACGVRITWAVPSSNGGKPILSYAIYASGGGTTHKKMAIVQGAATTTHFVTGLKRTTAYTFTVSATNEIGEGPKSAASVSVTTQNFRESRHLAKTVRAIHSDTARRASAPQASTSS